MLSDVYFPRVNGVSSSIRTYARALVRMGHEVTLVAPDYPDRVAQAAHDRDGFEVIRLAARTIFFDPEDRLIKGSALHAVIPALASAQWDVIYIHTPFRAHSLGVTLHRLTARPLVETYHTYFEQYVAHYLPWAPASWLRAFARFASRRLCGNVDHLIVPSTQMVDVLTHYGVSTPSTVLPTGLDLAEFAGGSGVAFRTRHGIDSERPTLVTVSRLAVEKNIGFLLEVVRELFNEFPTLLFIIAGEGPDAPRLRRLALTFDLNDNVTFFGNLDRRTALLDCYRAGDVFVFASPTETQGLVLIEAMALGVPIVFTAVMGTATVLRDARSARIAKDAVADFAAQVTALLRSPELRAELAAAGPEDARAWSVDGLMQRAEALYLSLAAAAPAVALRSSATTL